MFGAVIRIGKGQKMAKYKKKSREEVRAQKERMKGSIESEQDHIWFESETLKEFLLFAVKFRRYSYNNQLLIHAQKPGAAMVRTYKQWADCGRQVKKGEKGIEIFAPLPRKKTVEEEKLDSQGRKITGPDGKAVKEKKTIDYMDFRVEYVYDYGQTEGQPVPGLESITEDPLYETDGDLHQALKQACGDIPEGIPVQEMVFMACELAARKHFGSCGEQEAKARAYILSGYLQIELPEAYAQSVFSWAKGREKKEIFTLMQRVQKTAKGIITTMEQEDFVCTRPLSV